MVYNPDSGIFSFWYTLDNNTLSGVYQSLCKPSNFDILLIIMRIFQVWFHILRNPHFPIIPIWYFIIYIFQKLSIKLICWWDYFQNKNVLLFWHYVRKTCRFVAKELNISYVTAQNWQIIAKLKFIDNFNKIKIHNIYPHNFILPK